MTAPACASCGTPNEADARFCEGCGKALERTCGTCGVTVSATARFCKNCGGPVDGGAGPVAAAPTRKTVTVLFADLAGSTAFEEQVDAETAREVVGRYHDLLRSTAERHRAGVIKYIGDGFMAVWGVPEIGADDAGHAVEAAVELQTRFVDLAGLVTDTHGVDLALRVAVNTGEVVVGAGDADLVGDALNVGARLESECPHGHVVVGEETWRSTRGRHRYEPLGRVQVKGRTAAVAVYQWLDRRPETADSVPFIGRTDEFRRLQTAFDDAVAARSARLVTILGDPGVGKSRLAAEFAGAQGGGRMIQAYCAAEGMVALAPMVEVLRTRDLDADVPPGIPERDRMLRDLRGMIAGVAGSVEETFWALRRFVEVLASDGPLVLILDDIQWADTLLLDFVEHLTEWVRDVPVLLLALARPELRDLRPDLVTVGGWATDALRLGGLAPGATAELAAHVLGSDQLPVELLSRLPSSTGGNPLFVRELVGMLVHDGVLVAQPQGWRLTIDADAIAVPPTIQALLASRLERMNTANRRVLEIASVFGTDFSPAAVCALGGMSAAEVKNSLDRLRRVDLAQPSGTYVGDEPMWRFHHVLIRDVAYRRLLKSDRAELHERLADWVQAGGSGAAFESDELVARHLEAAHGYRCDLGTRDGHTRDLAVRAARSHLASARRALDRDELVSAGTQAARGAALAAADSVLHAELLLVGCEAFLSAGDVAAGGPLVDELDRLADEALAPWATCYRCQFIMYTDPARLPEADDRLHAAIDEFGRRGEAAGLAKAHRVRAAARARLGRVGDCEVDLFEALIAARRGGDHRQITAALGAAPNAALWGPSPVPKAGGRCLDVVRMQRMTTAAPSLEATSLRCLAVLELLRGRADKARSMLADARQIVADLGLRHGLMETELFAGIIELMEGDPVAAEPHFRTALEGLDALGVGADAGQAAALLARSVLAQGRIDEADRYAAESERIAGHNLKTAIAWRAVRAEILSAQGRHQDAVALAREAVAVAAATDLVLDHADTCLALSRVLTAAGDERRASDARRDAEALYAAKDAVFVASSPTQSAAPQEHSPVAAPSAPRLTIANQASKILVEGLQADSLRYSESFAYDDQRKFSGDPILGTAELQSAKLRKLEQYPNVEARAVAVRGETLVLISFNWSDDDGNKTSSLDLWEINQDGFVDFHGRFDDDAFWDAYTELERRYYAGEGAEFATNGRGTCAWMEATWQRDIEAAGRVSWPQFRWLASPSALKPAERSIDEFFNWLNERAQQLSSMRLWAVTMHWMSPNCYICLCEIQGAGADGEEYHWSPIYVGDYRDGLALSVREFEVEDEDQAFAYAQTLMEQPTRLAVRNRASEIADLGWQAMRAGDPDSVVTFYSDQIVYEDRRRLRGDPIDGITGLRNAGQRLNAQYPYLEWRTLAVRGESLALVWARWWDDSGNETSSFDLVEVGDDELIRCHCRFDEDDFWGAYGELERRHYAGEGAAYATNGRGSSGWIEAVGQRDLDAMRLLSHPDFCWTAKPSALKAAERSVDDMFHWMQERGRQVASQRHWVSVIHWLSPTCSIGRGEISAAGADGEAYQWDFLFVGESLDGLMASVREFDVEEEEQAFAYAETVVARRASRLTLANRATETGSRLIAALHAGDIDAAADFYSDKLRYDDRRRLSGDSVTGISAVRSALERITQQFNRFEVHTLAVRGEDLQLARYRWSDEAGNQSTGLVLTQIGEAGRVVYDGRFDEDDFEEAYRELDRRYYAGEGAAFAAAGAPLTEMIIADNRGDLDRTFSMFGAPGLRIESRSRSVFPSRTPEELRRSVEELGEMVASSQIWASAVCWLSDGWSVIRHEREAIGQDGEKYEWSRLYVSQTRDGMFTSLCEFDVDDEDAAFAYAEERMRATQSRLAVSNRASEVTDRLIRALQAHDIEGSLAYASDRYALEDRRQVSWDRPDIRTALALLFQQYNHFEVRMLAVRGERLCLGRARWSDDTGNESTFLSLIEIDDDGSVLYEGRFYEDDFESAYGELERRYYAGEGATFAEAGARLTAFVTTLNRGDMDTAFGMFGAADRQIESRSRSVFPDRTASELRGSLDQLRSMVSSVRWWYSALCWLSPDCAVARQEREATGPDGETYAWTQLYAGGFSGDVVLWACEFEVDDEDAAFAYAEERMRGTPSRLAISNRASAVAQAFLAALQRGDIDAAAAFYSSQVVYDDQRRLGGDPINGAVAVHDAIERLAHHYNRFELHTVAVRGDILQLAHNRWSDEAGNQSTGFILSEIAPDGKAIYDGRFDEEDFDAVYRELEDRYYASEGAEYAEQGRLSVRFLAAMDSLDVEAARRVCLPTFRWFTPPSTLVVQERSLDEFFRWLRERADQVSSVRNFCSVIRWLSPECFVALGDVQAQGSNNEEYTWARIYVGELRDGLLASMRQFDDEAAAFNYAEARIPASTSRLAVTNRATQTLDRVINAMLDPITPPETTNDFYSQQFAYDDRRRFSGAPIHDHAEAFAAVQRIVSQYANLEWHPLAVRGDSSALVWSRWSDEDGNETTALDVFQVSEDGRIEAQVRYDEDDFDAAYQELENRYYSGEGSAFAESGNTSTKIVLASNAGDLDRVFGELMTPDMRVDSRSGTIFPDRTTGEFRDSVELFQAMVSSTRIWLSAIKWLSPTCAVARQERKAVGQEGEKYTWTRIYVCEFKDGLGTALCDFDAEFEDQAFAYAEERMWATASRLAVSNRASDAAQRVNSALRAGDVAGLLSCCSEDYFIDDRRHFSGNPLRGHDSLRVGTERVLHHFNAFDTSPLAVRGERFALCLLKWSDDSGNESTHLHVIEIGDDHRIAYEVRFDEDDFEAAYRELETRYYAAEGAEFAEPGLLMAEYSRVKNRGDLDTLFGDLSTPDLHIKSRSHSVFLDRSAAEFRASIEELANLVSSGREWLVSIHWLSQRWFAAQIQRVASREDGEHYEWAYIIVGEIRNARLAFVCQFDPADEEAAFAYATERVRADALSLPVSNRASETLNNAVSAMVARDVPGAMNHYAEAFVYDDRRRLSGDPIENHAQARAAGERILSQFSHYEGRTLAVRGERLQLSWSRWSDDSGNETTHLHVVEIDNDGLIAYDGRFDEDDFENAYQELESRYYADEGAEFAECGAFNTEYLLTMNRGDFEAMFNQMTWPDLRVENRSRSVFPDRSAEDLHRSFEQLYSMLASVRSWFSATRWFSPTVFVGRLDREGVGHGGEQYAWTRILVNQYRDGRLASICEFDADDANGAFAYAEELSRDTANVLEVTNAASQAAEGYVRAMNAGNAAAAADHAADDYQIADRRQLSGDRVCGRAPARAAIDRILLQYKHFETQTLAVRGDALALTRSRWSDDTGNESAYLHVLETGKDRRIVSEVRFDEDDFEGAYRELETRYYAGESAQFAEYGRFSTEYLLAMNRGDFDTMFDESTCQDLRFENRSRSVFPDRSAEELRANFEDLYATVKSVRSWFSAIHWLSPTVHVGRLEREALGHDGEHYAWSFILVNQYREGRVAWIRQFDVDDEDAALAYAEELATQT